MNLLTQGLVNPGDHRKIDDGGPGIMAVHVEHLGITKAGPIFSIAHYYRQTGDAMRDPDMTFVRGFDNRYYPCSFRQDGGYPVYQVSWHVRDERCNLAMQADHVRFANTWMKNIKEQQSL